MNKNLYSADKLAGFLGLHRSDDTLNEFISQFGEDVITTVDREDDADDEFAEFKKFGFGFYFEKNQLLSISLHSSEKDTSYSRYDNPLPMERTFEQTRVEVVEALGEPEASGGGMDGTFGYVSEWLRYDLGDYYVHFEFSTDSMRIQMATLMLMLA